MQSKVKVRLVVSVLAVLTLAGVFIVGERPAVSQTSGYYTVTDLGILDGTDRSYATDVNISGQVCGYTGLANSTLIYHAFRTPPMTDLGTFGGEQSMAFGINNAGQVVGFADRGTSNRAALWSGGTITDITRKDNSVAYAINNAPNNAPQIVGTMPVSSRGTGHQNPHAFLWRNGKAVDLGTLGGNYSSASDINDSGQVVGGADLLGGTTHAFLWKPTTANGMKGTMFDLTLQGLGGATAINNLGWVVGGAQLWIPNSPNGTTGVVTSLAPLTVVVNGVPYVVYPDENNTFSANDINNNGQVVGRVVDRISFDPDILIDVAFIWDSVNGARDLNTLIDPNSGWYLVEANAINDSGHIVGWGDHNGQTRAFLLTPQ